jgi:hypothetical protein
VLELTGFSLKSMMRNFTASIAPLRELSRSALMQEPDGIDCYHYASTNHESVTRSPW